MGVILVDIVLKKTADPSEGAGRYTSDRTLRRVSPAEVVLAEHSRR